MLTAGLSPFSSPSPRFQRDLTQRPEKVLVALDVDKTLVPWTDQLKGEHHEPELQKTIDFFNRHNAEMFVMTNTGLSRDALFNLRHLFSRMNFIDAIGVNDGKEVYVRPDHTPMAQWFEQIHDHPEDAVWRAEVAKTGWNHPAVWEDIQNILKGMGFSERCCLGQQHTSGYLAHTQSHKIMCKRVQLEPSVPTGSPVPEWLVYYNPTETYLEFIGRNFPAGQTYTQELHALGAAFQERLGRALHTRHIAPQFLRKFYPKVSCLHFGPEGIDKGALVGHMVQRMPDLKAVITGGDSENDMSMLLRKAFTRANGTTVPNYPVYVGPDEPSKEAQQLRQTHGSGVAIFPERLAEGLHQQWTKICEALFPEGGSSRLNRVA